MKERFIAITKKEIMEFIEKRHAQGIEPSNPFMLASAEGMCAIMYELTKDDEFARKGADILTEMCLVISEA